MKKFVLIALASFASLSASAVEIRNVAICAVECRSEGLGVLGRDLAETGTVHYASAANPAHLETASACLANAKEAKIYSDRLEKDYQPLCVQVLQGKFTGKAVTLVTEEIGQIQGGFTGEPIPAIGVTKITPVR